MEKRAMLLIKTAAALRNPQVPAYVKQAAIEYIKSAGLFDSAMSGLSNFGSSLFDAGSSALSGASNMFGGIGSSIASGIGAMLPSGVTWENVAESLKKSDPEIARMASDPNFMDALKQAVTEAGPLKDVLSALGLA